MQVWTRGAAGRTHQRYFLTLNHTVADPYQYRLAVPIAGGVAVAVIDFDGIPVAFLLAGVAHYAAAHGLDFRTETAGNVHALMKSGMARKRVGTLPEAGCLS